MRVNDPLKLRKYQQLLLIILVVMTGTVGSAHARDLNAGFVLNEMNADQRTGYLFGVVEGLAYARFLRDKPDQTGMNCIYDWYHGAGSDKRQAKAKALMRRHADKPVGPLLYVLMKKECGA